MEPASAAAAAAGGGSGKKASSGNSRGDADENAPSSSLPSSGRPALADLIGGTGVFAQQESGQLLEQQDAPPTKRQRTLWPTPGGAAGAAAGLQVRSGRIATLESQRERIRNSLLGEKVALPLGLFSLYLTSRRLEETSGSSCSKRKDLKKNRERERERKRETNASQTALSLDLDPQPTENSTSPLSPSLPPDLLSSLLRHLPSRAARRSSPLERTATGRRRLRSRRRPSGEVRKREKRKETKRGAFFSTAVFFSDPRPLKTPLSSLSLSF